MPTETQDIARRAAGPGLDAKPRPNLPFRCSPRQAGAVSTPICGGSQGRWRHLHRQGDGPRHGSSSAISPQPSAAARQAAEAGVGPKVLAADVAARTLVMEDLSAEAGWSAGTLDKVLDRATRLKVLRRRKAFHRTKPLGPQGSTSSQQIEALLDKCRSRRGAPAGGHRLARHQRARGARRDRRLRHRPCARPWRRQRLEPDVLGATGEVRLIDWDMAGDMDPLLDVGAFLVEAHDSESDAAECFEAFNGRFERALFNRAWLYGVADDFRWGLIGALLAGTSRRETYEFLKFGDWRFLRARMAIRDPRFSEKLGRL